MLRSLTVITGPVYPLPSRLRGGLVRHLALGEKQGRPARAGSSVMGRSGLAGFRFPPNVIAVAVRWYPATACPTGTSRNRSPSTTRGRSRHSLSVSEPVDSAIHRRRPAPPALHSGPMVRRRDDVIISGRWRYLYRAVDQFGQVIAVLLSPGAMSQRPVASSSKRWRSDLLRMR